MGSEELVTTLRRLGSAFRKTRPLPRVDLVPGCAFGALVEERLRAMERHLEEMKGRVNGLIYLVIGAVVVEVVLRLLR